MKGHIKKLIFALMSVISLIFMAGCLSAWDGSGVYTGDKEPPLPVAVTGVTLSAEKLTLRTGQSIQVTATVLPKDANNATVSWSSENYEIADLWKDHKGIITPVTGVNKGVTKISVTTYDGGFRAECIVRVTDESSLSDIALDKTELRLSIGGSGQLTPLFSPEGFTETDKTVFWSVLDGTVASVYGGLVTGNGAGETVVTVRANDGGFTADCAVSVFDPDIVSEVKLTRNVLCLLDGDEFTLGAEVLPATALDKSVTWSVKSGDSVSISSSGVVSAQKLGVTEILVTSNDGGVTDICTVTVGEPTEGLEYTLSGGGLYYNVSKGTANVNGNVFIAKVWNHIPVKGIAAGGFKDCEFLEGVAIYDGIEYVGADAFTGTKFLSDISDGIVYLGKALYTVNGDRAAVTEAVLRPDTVSVTAGAFKDCINLTEIQIPDGIKIIDAETFKNCVKLKSVFLPAGLTRIGKEAFSGTADLDISLASLTALSSIDDFAFYKSGIKSIFLPAGLSEVGLGAFGGCGSLAMISVEDSPYFSHINGILYNKDKTELVAYPGAKTGNITVSGIEKIAPYAFYMHTAVSNLIISSGVTEIGNRAFYGCAYLESVSLPVELTVIGDYAFDKCDKLVSVVFPNGKGGLEIGAGNEIIEGLI